jgi:hypothetical protein
MKVRTNRTIKSCRDIFVAVLIFSFYRSSYSQNLSNGSLNFIFTPANDYTQFVVWLEDGDGKYIETIFLTGFIGRRGGGNRTSDPDIDIIGGNRLSALPVWSHKRGVIDTTFGLQSYYPPEESKPSYPADIDAISGATPPNSLQNKTLHLSNLPYGTYRCWIEVCQSYNSNYYHNYSYYRGQPSVVWLATINVTQNPDSCDVLNYTGYGSPDGSNGDINPPDQTITTASDLINDMGGYKFKVVYSPKESLGVEENYASSSQNRFCILKQNFPNPVNPSTIISYSLLKSGNVTLKIYNIWGENVLTLVNTFQLIGDYSVNLINNTLSSGLYYYRLQLGNYSTDTKIMIVLH